MTASAEQRLDLSEAVALIEAQTQPIDGEDVVPIADACGRVTADPIIAPVSLPPFPASAMDGYAFAFDRCRLDDSLTIVGTAAAGHPFEEALPPQSCVRILTGAALPTAADTVVIQENASRSEDKLTINHPPARGANVRTVGQDVEAGAVQLPARRALTPFDLAFLAACGHETVKVFRKIRVRLLSSGDELTDPGRSLRPGQIYDSNRQLLSALLKGFPIEILGSERVADDPAAVGEALAQSGDADLLLTSGGVSVGDSDFLGQTLQREGTLQFWRLNLKPGKPVALGRLPSGTWVLALPGNPVSTAVTALLLGRPLLLRLAGSEPRPVPTMLATLATPLNHSVGREEYQRGQFTNPSNASQGQLPTVAVTGDQSSNRLSTFTDAECLLRIPKACGNLPAGSTIEVLSLSELLRP